MPLASNNPKGRHWENVALPIITTVSPGSYNNPLITVDEFGRVIQISSSSGTGIAAQASGSTVPGGPFNILNFLNGTATAGATGVLDITTTGSVSALEEGVAIAGGPFDSINFIGPDITATDAGGGQLDINVLAGGGSRVQFVRQAIGTSATQNVGLSIDPTSIVREISVSILSPYDSGTTIEIQDGLGNIIMASSFINAEVLGSYILPTPQNFTAISNPQVVAIVGGSPTAGSALVDIIYQVT